MAFSKSGRPKLVSVKNAEKLLNDLLAGRFRPGSQPVYEKIAAWSGPKVAIHLLNEYGLTCNDMTGLRILRDAREGGKVYFAYCWSKLVGKRKSPR